MKFSITLHPKGLAPLEAAKAWYLRKKGKESWLEIKKKVKTVQGKRPGQRALENAVRRQGKLKKAVYPAIGLCQLWLHERLV